MASVSRGTGENVTLFSESCAVLLMTKYLVAVLRTALSVGVQVCCVWTCFVIKRPQNTASLMLLGFFVYICKNSDGQ